MSHGRIRVGLWLAFALGSACADEGFKPGSSAMDPAGNGGSLFDAGFTNPGIVKPIDAGPALSPDAFFINDPPPPHCGEDGKMAPPPAIEGTLDCPGDKNREGCPCLVPGMQAPCWPGKRINRNHGVCHDGVTTCIDSQEFGGRWGACEGYTLPVEGAQQSNQACRCFSNGKWTLSNLVPCIFYQQASKQYFIYSSRPDPVNGYVCDAVTSIPPAVPSGDWSTSELTVDCGGRFVLCYTIKAGSAAQPSSADCVLTRSCVEVWYAQAGTSQKLANLPGWVATDAACTKRFIEQGGYGEMTVQGKSLECELIDDGQGRPFVFKRAGYCPPRCVDTPEAEECRNCAAGGAGDF